MGYDLNRFVKEVDEEFICPICTMVLENGVQSQHCEHTYCDVCIREWLSINKSCPVDRKELNLTEIKPISRKLNNLLLKLEIKCDFEENGCQSVVKLEFLCTHRKSCLFDPNMKIKCTKECGLVMTQLEYQCHNCLSKLASLLAEQQKQMATQQRQILCLEKEVQYLRKTLLWYSVNDGLTVLHNIIECNKKDFGEFDTGVAQYNCPLEENNPYFEIKIIELGIGIVMIGLSDYRLRHDWSELNRVYYKVDGTAYILLFHGTEIEKESVTKWQNGDTIGCGIKFESENSLPKDLVIVYLTHNKKIVWEKSVNPANFGLYPTLITNSFGAKLVASTV